MLCLLCRQKVFDCIKSELTQCHINRVNDQSAFIMSYHREDEYIDETSQPYRHYYHQDDRGDNRKQYQQSLFNT